MSFDIPPAPILLAGATGLLGGLALGLLAQGQRPVLAPTRRSVTHNNPKLHPIVSDLSDPAADPALAEQLRRATPGKLVAYLCCLGTTIKTAGSRAAFEAVDHGLALRLGRIARELGASHAILVSSVGADAKSSNFYLAVKGRTEADLAALGFARVDCLRPGLLLGERKESRPGEALAQRLAPLYNPLLLGPLRRYRSIAAADVAKAAIALLSQSAPGVFVHEHDSLVRLATQPSTTRLA